MKQEVFYLVSKWDDNLVFNSRHLLKHLDLVSTLSQLLIVSPAKISEFISQEILRAHEYNLLPWSLVDEASSTRNLGTRLGLMLAKPLPPPPPPKKNDADIQPSWSNKFQSATKWVETVRPELGFFQLLLTSKGRIQLFPPIPPCNVVPLFELPLKNNKHLNFEWRGQGRGVDSFHLLSYPIWVQCLNNFVADCW